MYVDSHAHLARNPEHLEDMANNSVVEQVWLLDISFYTSGRVVELATPEEILEAARRYPGFYIPFGFLDFNQGPEIVDKLKDQGFVGLKAIRPAHPYDDERYFPYYERAEKLNMPIVFHTGVVSRATRSMLTPGLSTNSSNMRPGYAMGIAAAFPELILVLAHLGAPWGEEAFSAALSHPNIYLDLSGGQSEFKVRWLNEYLHRGVAEKLLLSVDSTYGREQYHNDVLHMLNFWNDYFEIILRRHEAYRHKDAIFRGTALSIISKYLDK